MKNPALPSNSWLVLVWFCLAAAPLKAQLAPKNRLHATPWSPPKGRASASDFAVDSHAPVPALPPPLSTATWTAVGPASLREWSNYTVSGRVTGIAASASDPNTIYLAAAGGGVWKTANAGASWIPLTDNQATLAMGAIAIAPSNPKVIYAGTGEANNSGDSNYGLGVLVSSDGGATWTLSSGPAGAFTRRTVAQIAIDPLDAHTAYIAVGDLAENGSYGNTGIWKTTDGGATWANTTASIDTFDSWSAIVIDPHNRQLLYAAIGNAFGAAKNGIYKSTDAGGSWSLLSAPSGTAAGRIALALAPTDSQVLYAVYSGTNAPGSSSFGTLYRMLRSNDGGGTFLDLSAGVPEIFHSQGDYDIAIAVDPASSAIVYCAGVASILKSTDSGQTWTDIALGGPPNYFAPHVDHHALAFDASGNLLDGGDGGLFRLDNAGTLSWSDLNSNLQTIQVTGIGLHPTNATIAVGGSQDNGTEIYAGNVLWNMTDGGDGGFAKISQQNGNLMYHQIPYESSNIFFKISTDNGNTWHSAVANLSVDGQRQNFYAPFAVDPGNGNRVLYGTYRIWETTNAGASWSVIGDAGVAGFNSQKQTINAIGLAPSDANTVYASAGVNLFVTTDHGNTWADRNLPGGGFVEDIEVDSNASQLAYAVANAFDPVSGLMSGQVYVTTNGGTAWTNISGNLPAIPAWWLQKDGDGTLYVSNDNGVYQSLNGGATWNRFGAGLPNAQGVQIELNRSLRLLGVATHGRGMWEILLPPVCSFSLNPISANAPVAGGPASISFASSSCSTPVASNSTWIHVTSAATVSNGGTVTYSVDANSGATRVGPILIGAALYYVTQAGTAVTTIQKTHTGTFTQGQTGATYSLTVSNQAGAGPSAGTVTVTEALPAGLALVSMAGSGWICTANTCTRNDVLAAGASYPPITVTVNVAANATSPLQNQASVSGGGSATKTTTDSTTIVAPQAPPVINSVFNAAGYQSGVFPGSLISVKGSNLTPIADDWSHAIVNGQLPSQLDGVTVTIGGKPAFIFQMIPTQINVQAPDVGPGNVTVVVQTPQGTSAPFTATAQTDGPAFWPWPSNQPVATHPDYSIAAKNGTFAGTATIPAKPGEILTLWGTGFGPTIPLVPAGQLPANNAGAATQTVTVALNGAAVTVIGAALSSYPGDYQVAIQIPATLADGDYPLIATVNNVSSPTVTLTVAH